MFRESFDKFALLMWKHWKVMVNHPYLTASEFLFTIACPLVLLIVCYIVRPTKQASRMYKPFYPLNEVLLAEDLLNETDYRFSNFTSLTLAYSPSNNKMLDRALSLLTPKFKNIEKFENRRLLEQRFTDDRNRQIFAAFEFSDDLLDIDFIPPKIQVFVDFLENSVALNYSWDMIHIQRTARRVLNFCFSFILQLILTPLSAILGKISLEQRTWMTNIPYPKDASYQFREGNDPTGESPNYFKEGFLALQTLITYALMLVQTNSSKVKELPVMELRRFPLNFWLDDPLLPYVAVLFQIVIMLNSSFAVQSIIDFLTIEKEKQLKESMKIMGLPGWLHWTTYYVRFFLFGMCSTCLTVVLLKFSYFTHIGFGVFLLFMLFFLSATITLSFAISVFFNKSSIAALCGGLIFVQMDLPFILMQLFRIQPQLQSKLLITLISNNAMAFALDSMLHLQISTEGIEMVNLWTPVGTDTLPIGMYIVMLLIDSIFYMFITLYFEAVLPEPFGAARPWYCPFAFFQPKSLKKGLSPDQSSLLYFEPDPHLNAGIETINLQKRYGKKVVLKSLSFSIYENHITALLGHNGAGKSVTIAIIAGTIPPSGGTAYVRGYDVRKNLAAARSSMGICPQSNILFSELTVREHLYFFTRLKGMSKDMIKDEVEKFLKELELDECADRRPHILSTGTNRKLCVAIALCGNSKVVMLDEPTAGMDVSARRSLWRFMQKEKMGRTILITTHFLDMADKFCDRIAIMINGRLKCCGSSSFLKRVYGAGYYLTINLASDCNPEIVTNFLKRYFPYIKVYKKTSSELSYRLDEAEIHKFHTLLGDLEYNTKMLKIENYLISMATLEEVFMKVVLDFKPDDDHSKALFQNWVLKCVIPPYQEIQNDSDKDTKVNECTLIVNQIIAIFIKRLFTTFRAWGQLLIQIVASISYVILTILVIQSISYTLPQEHSKSTILSLDMYKDARVIMDKDSNNYGNLYFPSHLEYYPRMPRMTKIRRVLRGNITKEMMLLNEKSVLRSTIIAGISFETRQVREGKIRTVLTAWFNGFPHHSSGVSLGLTLNAIYKRYTGTRNSIIFHNYPFPYKPDTQLRNVLTESVGKGFVLALCLGTAMAIVCAFYSVFYIKERACNSLHLQLVAGVKVYVVWIVAFIWDLIVFFIPVGCILVTFIAFQEVFGSFREISRLLFVFFYFAVSILPLMYLVSTIFRVPYNGMFFIIIIGFLIVGKFCLLVAINDPASHLKFISEPLGLMFLFVPLYSFMSSINNMHIQFSIEDICEKYVKRCLTSLNFTNDQCTYLICHNTSETFAAHCCGRMAEISFFKWQTPGIGMNATVSLATAPIVLALVILLEYKPLRFFQTKAIDDDQEMEDSTAIEEKQKIDTTLHSELVENNAIVLKDVTKYYKTTVALKGVNLAVGTQECFGMIGPNGSGKTTIFQIITGNTKMNRGEAWVNQYNVNTDLKKARESLSYCPQADAFLGDLTGRETLIIFCLIRGVPRRKCDYLCKKLSSDLGFNFSIDKLVKQMSMGTKRKLSAAVAFIDNNTPVICLDEPVSGMDSTSKSNFWKQISHSSKSRCIVFTSHHMEDCEAVCSRIGIMVHGRFKYLGTIQNLKNKYAEGYTLTIKCKSDQDIKAVERYIQRNFSSAELREKYQETLTYYIEERDSPYSQMFKSIESSRKKLHIVEYSIRQLTLEQVFLMVTQHHKDYIEK